MNILDNILSNQYENKEYSGKVLLKSKKYNKELMNSLKNI